MQDFTNVNFKVTEWLINAGSCEERFSKSNENGERRQKRESNVSVCEQQIFELVCAS